MRSAPTLPLLAAVLTACSTAPAREAPAAPAALAREAVARVTASGSPSLEEIFLLPGPEGQAPRVESLSADGRFALVRWSPLVRDARGRRATSERPDLWLVPLDPDARGADAALPGAPLEDLLPPPTATAAGARRSAATWSEAGARLAVVRGGELFVLEPAASGWDVRLLHVDGEAEAPEDAQADGDAPPDERARPTRLGRGARVAWVDGDRALRVILSGDVLVLELAAADAGLAGARWLGESLAEGASGVQWSDDDRVAFRVRPPVARLPVPEPPAQEPTGEASDDEGATDAQATPDPAPRGEPAHVLHLADGRAVALEGLDGLEGLESERLSPDGAWVFAFDEARTPEPERNLVPDFLTERVTTRNARRERADDGGRARTAWVWSTDDGARTALAWDEWPDALLWPLGWAPQPAAEDGTRPPARFALQRTSADRARREVWCFEGGAWRRLFSERDPHWLGGPAGGARWSVDGRRLLVPAEWMPGTSTPGRCQLFAVDADSGAVRQLTEVEGELDGWSQAADGRIALTASRDDPGRRALLVVEPEGGPARELALPPGYLDGPRLAGESVLVGRATLGLPAELWWVAADGSRAAALGDSVPRELREAARVLPETLRVTGALGATVWSHVWLPDGVSLEHADRPRACVVFVHGAGYLQNVSDSLGEYAVNFLFHERLARMGYVVLDVDYRGSKGYGALFRGEVQHHLGGHDLDDIARSVDELVARGLVDAGRVGLYGGSYGGFLTLMALFTQPERWAAGAALRSVTDWRSYHPGYTVPRLGRPSTHPESYQRSSPIDHAANLRDPLLLLHGMVDSNVFAQDTIRLMEALIDLGLPFEAMLYPSQGHGFDDGQHWLDEYGRIEAFLVGHLGAP